MFNQRGALDETVRDLVLSGAGRLLEDAMELGFGRG